MVVMDEFYTNYATVKFPHDIFTQQNYNINDVSFKNKSLILRKLFNLASCLNILPLDGLYA